jgi:hypothetical protein
MGTSSVDSGAEKDTINGDELAGNEHTTTHESNEDGTHPTSGRIMELLEEERDNAPTPQQLGNGTNRFKTAQNLDSASENGSSEALPRRAGSPIESIPDDSPSVQVIRWPRIP